MMMTAMVAMMVMKMMEMGIMSNAKPLHHVSLTRLKPASFIQRL